jgi:hypothetical protein
MGAHKHDSRSPCAYQYDVCNIYHADLYQLAKHEDKCKYKPSSARETCYRSPLDAAATRSDAPSLIVINRSSSHPSKSWKAGKKTRKKGLPIIAGTSWLNISPWTERLQPPRPSCVRAQTARHEILRCGSRHNSLRGRSASELGISTAFTYFARHRNHQNIEPQGRALSNVRPPHLSQPCPSS